jgi:hypothetical protein
VYSEAVLGLAGVGLVDVGDALAEVVGGGGAVVDALQTQDGLVGVLGDFGSACDGEYLLKLRNLALTHSLTWRPGPAFLAIFLLLAAPATSDIWLKIIIEYNAILIFRMAGKVY